jgi:hypothetical protein
MVDATFPRRLAHGLCAVFGLLGLIMMGTGAPASAATRTPGPHGRGGGGGGTALTAQTGNDVSYPQCGKTLPTSPAFGIVGLNDGLANDLNPCFGPSSSYPSYIQSELYWAVADSTGKASGQPDASVYVNTGDPGNLSGRTPVADWPTSGTTPYGPCTTTTVTSRGRTYTVGADSTACAWEYGHERATQDVTWLSSEASAIDAQAPPDKVAATPSSYPWWFDVETGNSWQTGTAGIAMNVADLQGMVAALRADSISAMGVYSTASQWAQIAGTTTSASGSLDGLPDWVPGASTLTGAKANCSLASFTQGAVVVTQWTGTFDDDHAC